MVTRCTKWLSNIPNGRKIYQHFPFHWDFWFENIPFGNPDLESILRLWLTTILQRSKYPSAVSNISFIFRKTLFQCYFNENVLVANGMIASLALML
jgi:hypothetical protein